MRNHPVATAAPIFLCGLLLSLLTLFLTDPYCRQIQAKRLAESGRRQIDIVSDEIDSRVANIKEIASQLTPTELTSSERLEECTEALLAMPGVFGVEVLVRDVDRVPGATLMERMTRGPADDSHADAAPATYRVTYAKSNYMDISHCVGSMRPSQIGRLTSRNGGIRISNVRQFHKSDISRRGVFVSVGPRDQRLGLLLVTFEHLVPPQLLEATDVALTMTQASFVSPEERQIEERVTNADEESFELTKNFLGKRFEFVVTEQAGANLRPTWIKWAVFLACKAITCIIGLSWLQRGRADLLERNRELELEVNRRIATQKHLQSTLDFRDHEREVIAHEIHDGFVQDMIGAQMYAESTLAQSEDGSLVHSRLSIIAELLAKAVKEARRTIDYLKPQVVDEVGLVQALRSSVEHDLRTYDFKTDLRSDDSFPRLPILVERMLFRVIREASCNARQHSGCDSVLISLSADDEWITAEIADEGLGFENEGIRIDSFGLAGMRQRIDMLDGRLDIKTAEAGTKVTVQIPRDIKSPDMPKNESLLLDV